MGNCVGESGEQSAAGEFTGEIGACFGALVGDGHSGAAREPAEAAEGGGATTRPHAGSRKL